MIVSETSFDGAVYGRQKTRPQWDPKGLPDEENWAETTDPDELILCAQCRQVITHPSQRVHISGAHRHTFFNPHGILYEIGCYGRVQGCGHAGPPTSDFSWFKGYTWRVAVCTGCLTHLGWLFEGADGANFHGLIFDRLIGPK